MGARDAHGTVRYCSTGPGERALVKAFNGAHTGTGLRARFVDVSEGSGHSLREWLEIGLTSGVCDVTPAASTWAAQLGAEGAALDLTKYARARKPAFFPAALAANAYHGRQWAIPRAVTVSVLYVAPGKPGGVPKTWDELLDDRGPARGVAVAGDGSDGTALAFIQLLYSAGGRLLGPGGRSAVSGPAGRRALGLLARAWDSGTIRTTPEESGEDVAEDFHAGEETYMPGQSGIAAYLQGDDGLGAILVQQPHFPGRPSRPLVLSLSTVVSAASKRKHAAVAFMDWLTTPAAVAGLARNQNAPPLMEGYRDREVLDALSGAEQIRDALARGAAYPSSPHYDAFERVIGRSVHRVLTGTLTVEQALRQMARGIDAAQHDEKPEGAAS